MTELYTLQFKSLGLDIFGKSYAHRGCMYYKIF